MLQEHPRRSSPSQLQQQDIPDKFSVNCPTNEVANGLLGAQIRQKLVW